MKNKTVIRELSSAIGARIAGTSIIFKGKLPEDWMDRHENTIQDIVDNYLPSGSGIDNITELDFEKSTAERIIIKTAYHPINKHGMYVDWIDYRVVITPSLQFDFNLNIIDNFSDNKSDPDLKNYLIELYETALLGTYEKESCP